MNTDHSTKITPSYGACKEFVCKVLPRIMIDLRKKGKLPPKESRTTTTGEYTIPASHHG